MANFFGKLIKKNGKLQYTSEAQKRLYKEFVDSIPENAIVEFYSDSQETNGTISQLAKVHAMIRELANHTGYTFDEMKLYVKKEAGMCYTSSEGVFICESFGDCSKEELSNVIQTIQQIGLKVNCPV